MFKGHEDDAFAKKARQPNLACNIFYWVWDVEERWSDKFWSCDAGTQEFTCSDSYWCNWTNNPQVWSVEWFVGQNY